MRKTRSDKNTTWDDLEKSFLAKVDGTNEQGCWLWIGARYPNGYGAMSFLGKVVPAHRAGWMIANRVMEFPEGMYACHSCDVKLCVNPDHITPGTPSENSKHAWRSRREGKKTQEVAPQISLLERRTLYGDNRCILTEAIVLEMKRRRKDEGCSYGALGRDYGVSETTARFACQEKRWGHLQENK